MNRKTLVFGVLLLGISLTGCGDTPGSKKAEEKKAVKTAKKNDHDHDHGEGPHGGTIFDFGKFHAEFCMDHAKKQATVYILTEDFKKADPIPVAKLLLSIKNPQFQTDLIATPQEGDPKDKSSRFTATHENFAKEQEFEGVISGEIEGKPYLGDFKEEEHKGHKH